jgi:hypothetical protein
MNKNFCMSLALALAVSTTQVHGEQHSESANHQSALVTSAVNWTPVIVKPTTSPALVRGDDGKYNLVYELSLSNLTRSDANIQKLDIIDADSEQIVQSFAGDSLAKILVVLTPDSIPTNLKAASNAIVFVNLTFDKATGIPKNLKHRIKLETKYPRNKQVSQEYTSVPLVVSELPAVVISPPLGGEGWLASGGYSGDVGHRRALMPIGNELKLAQRYAIDWIKVNDKNLLLVGDLTKCENYFCYGEPIHAVADGTILGTMDRFGDQVPGKAEGDDVTSYPGGNIVVIDIGQGNYAFYAHMKPGSIKVKAGDKVSKGQIIGEVGNSGNTSSPHLHMHISDSPSPLGADGKPYVFDSFKVTAYVPNMRTAVELLEAGKTVPSEPVTADQNHKQELIREGTIVTFPN